MTSPSDASDNLPVNQFFQAADDDLTPPGSASLSTGLTALKQGDYKTAIAHLESVCQSALDEATHLKAQMGLIKAYDKTGDLKLAIALCKPLCQHSSERVKQWSQQALDRLEQRVADAIAPSVDTPSPSVESPSPAIDPTGFVPFTGGSAPAGSPPAGSTQIQSSRTQIQPPALEEPDPGDIAPPVIPPPHPLPPTVEPDRVAAPREHGPFDQWRNSPRASKWNPLPAKKGQQVETWVIQGLTGLALILLLRGTLQGLVIVGHTLRNLATTILFNQQHGMPSTGFLWWVVPVVFILWAIAPWGMTLIMRWNYGAQSLSDRQLDAHSPETLRLLKRLSNRERCPRPRLLLLPTPIPVTLTYGHLPHFTWLVLSQGVLDQLQDDELASIAALEMGHILQRTTPLMTLLVFLTQLPYLIYWRMAQVGDRLRIPVVNWPFALLSLLGYGLYWLLRYPALWLSRYRIGLGDRISVNQTGNPNALIRALLKLQWGMADSIQQQRQTPYLLDSLDLLMPISPRQALTLSSIRDRATLDALLARETHNAYRHWLSINQTHPPLSDRLLFLSRCAQRWQLEPECTLPTTTAAPARRGPLLQQGAPFFGIAIGLGIAAGLWLVGLGAWGIGLEALRWLWGDRPLMYGLACISSGIGLLLRVNPMFPDITRTNSVMNPPLGELLTDAPPLPVHGRPVQLHGQLLGRSGFSNLLEQDLLLKTESGLVRLHYLSPLGILGNILPQPGHPHQALQRTVTITGWFRQGATPWVDIDRLQIQGKYTIRSGHPIWSTLVAVALALTGSWIIVRGIG
jgi:Zn-dependent protease with chaperone function